ncbi:hypothetical protein [Halobacillus litoralis]|uniref:hypothetical protein n=1 Tax=Halobacillus litoralis TaxID=45668 RepID=UPI001CFD9045|nr:hypothetical protein [Halobacillus litoralis]
MDLFLWVFIAFVVIGLVTNVITSDLKDRNKHILCRLGIHRYKHVDWEEKSPGAIYKCEKCGKTKRVIRGM